MSGPFLGGKRPLVERPWVQKLMALPHFTSEQAGWAAGKGGTVTMVQLKGSPELIVTVVGWADGSDRRRRLYRLERRRH